MTSLMQNANSVSARATSPRNRIISDISSSGSSTGGNDNRRCFVTIFLYIHDSFIRIEFYAYTIAYGWIYDWYFGFPKYQAQCSMLNAWHSMAHIHNLVFVHLKCTWKLSPIFPFHHIFYASFGAAAAAFVPFWTFQCPMSFVIAIRFSSLL